ncbi:hypothetical protein SLOPH_2521 [Spraguea lophii 42_110]|uniref:Uncharacterized protein n=1 Tax=Spraguea lophii (strain 42_110) TaxID=1358809 RepID=S7XPK1_SPRLO|nr:hypothetical protein SLOPH_2521 [Spraguea lophii 42_110]
MTRMNILYTLFLFCYIRNYNDTNNIYITATADSIEQHIIITDAFQTITTSQIIFPHNPCFDPNNILLTINSDQFISDTVRENRGLHIINNEKQINDDHPRKYEDYILVKESITIDKDKKCSISIQKKYTDNQQTSKNIKTITKPTISKRYQIHLQNRKTFTKTYPFNNNIFPSVKEYQLSKRKQIPGIYIKPNLADTHPHLNKLLNNVNTNIP